MTKSNTTSDDWRQRLKAAFTRNAAFGLFIDYQEHFYDTNTHSAFVKGGKLASSLHSTGIESLWGAASLHRRFSLTNIYKDAILKGTERFKFARPAPDEIVYLKYAHSICNNTDASARIENMNHPVLIAGGVYATKCFGASIVDIMHIIPCDVIIALDATDFETADDTEKLNHMYNFSALHNSKRNGRYHVATVQQIISALPRPH